MLNIKTVNKAVAKYGVQLTKGTNYFYWLDLYDGLLEGVDSEMVLAINHLTLEQWIICAANAARQHAEYQCERRIHTQPQVVIPSKGHPQC